ncbi:RAVE protein 1 C terminal-domain-containing protein [Geopyxis carbonaria]|nr:RAVE protein 1 C terminal-domain-containing protein [Geopyxis carbonaria]
MLLPGKPQAKLQAVCAGEWQRKRIIVYISGTALCILSGVDKLLQTIYHDDDQLTAAALDESTGKIAVCAESVVFVYKPNGRAEGYIQWDLQTQISLPASDSSITTLSWGDPDELLIGSKSLTLWSTANSDTADTRLLWRRTLANKARLALFCPDASLLASVAENDRLVKVWRKISIGSDDTQFDFSYLPHPRAVVSIHWRQRIHPEESADNVLYTIASDQVLRVWAPVYPHDVHLLQLWAVVDLRNPGSLHGLDPPNCDEARHAFIVDSKVFRLATEMAVGSAGDGDKERAILQRLIEVANRSPEVVMVFDARGKMSAWGLENVGCKSRKTTNVFSIVQGEDSEMEELIRDSGGCEVHFTAFAGDSGMVILAHFWDGRICWLESRLDQLLDPSPRTNRFLLQTVWTGHSGQIHKMTRTADGTTLLTSTVDNEHYLWSKVEIGGSIGLQNKSRLPKTTDRVRRACILDHGNYLMTLHEDYVVLWDTTQNNAKEIERLSFKSRGKMLCLLVLPESEDNTGHYRVISVGAELTGIAWDVRIPTLCKKENQLEYNNEVDPYLKEISHFNLGSDDKVVAVVPVDPVGWNAVLSENLDMFSREVMTTVCSSGLLKSWTVKVFQEESEVRWLATSRVNTSIKNPSLAKGNSIRKFALVDASRSELTIWDSKAGTLEYRKQFADTDVIRDLDWTSTPQSQSILAVGFPTKVILMCQLRYDYLNAGPAWAPFREINIQNMTPHPIGDSIWLDDGGLVVGSGNQLFVYPRKIDEIDETLDSLHLSSHNVKMEDLFDIVSELNGPLPTYHPQFLQQCILAGKSSLVETILVRLYKELSNYHEEIGIDGFLNIPIEVYFSNGEYSAPKRRSSKYNSFFESYTEDSELTTFDETLSSKLLELLTNIAIPHLTGQEQISLAGIVESMEQVNQHRRSIDDNGALYLLFFRQQTLRREKRTADMSFREITWAFHSDSQEIMVDIVKRNSNNRMLWPQARESGMFVWLRDQEAIKRQFEILARNHYTQTDEKNPVDCSLYYLALKKKNVLTGLWRMASWNKEQTSTHKFLSNNFAEPRWKTAAMKNAYALLGKHRFEYAAAFFLLADSLKDAVNVCYSQMKDMQLAIAIARVYEGDDGPVLRDLLEKRILPHACNEGDRWLATWAFWMLNRKDLAVRALLSPLNSLISEGAEVPDPESRLFLLDDPALVIFYKQIREKTLQTLKGAEKITPEQEFQFVLHTARLYDRMGCDLLALDLVKNWEFMAQDRDALKPLIEVSPKRHHMRRRSSITVADAIPSSITNSAEQQFKLPANLVKPPVAVFQEPDMSWAF